MSEVSLYTQWHCHPECTQTACMRAPPTHSVHSSSAPPSTLQWNNEFRPIRSRNNPLGEYTRCACMLVCAHTPRIWSSMYHSEGSFQGGKFMRMLKSWSMY